KDLPLLLPEVKNYKPGPDGEGPLANIPEWTARHLETSTMPGYAGSSWYFLRYMDPHNTLQFCDRKASDYWGQVDLYIGGTEHAVGHLLYSRMWTKFLFDLDLIGFDEPFRRLLNQGMIQGSSRFVYRLSMNANYTGPGKQPERQLPPVFISKVFFDQYNDKNISEQLLIKVSRLIGNEMSIWFSAPPVPLHVDVQLVDGVQLNIKEFKKW